MKKVILFANWGLGEVVLKLLLESPSVELLATVTQYGTTLETDRFHNCVHNINGP